VRPQVSEEECNVAVALLFNSEAHGRASGFKKIENDLFMQKGGFFNDNSKNVCGGTSWGQRPAGCSTATDWIARWRHGIGLDRSGADGKSNPNGVPAYAYDDECMHETVQPVCKKKGVGIDDGLVYHPEYEPVGQDECRAAVEALYHTTPPSVAFGALGDADYTNNFKLHTNVDQGDKCMVDNNYAEGLVDRSKGGDYGWPSVPQGCSASAGNFADDYSNKWNSYWRTGGTRTPASNSGRLPAPARPLAHPVPCAPSRRHEEAGVVGLLLAALLPGVQAEGRRPGARVHAELPADALHVRAICDREVVQLLGLRAGEPPVRPLRGRHDVQRGKGVPL
jgi:hypothetical protein